MAAEGQMIEFDARILTILVCGAGTFGMRLLPMLWQQRSETRHAELLSRLSRASGSAAVASLMVVMLWPMIVQAGTQQLAAVFTGLLTTWGSQRVFSGVALPALSGAVVYGLVKAWL
ncbi:hypothetical protein D8B22_18790 [Verminephrobacter aporrectodeae subsp. tuberculatae]|nr:hypothetical protein [Verminephrobacter aporrectodeae subsp. tuberculatae]MCW8171105.1 hypothetical protein [Verminephrobacter aporrectodeae subsp. tuberculatae]MCW8208477.1 hypothetical protein [Verminephrobacter aporrectodeae subsp. tuberculatae]